MKHVFLKKTFDIFFSHCWADKAILSHVYSMLTDLGFRVWYDENEMGWNLDKSMRDGVGQSKVFLCCFNSTYETRANCLLELKECVKVYPDKPVITLMMEDPWDKSTTWKVKQEFKDMLDFNKKMFCPIHEVASNMAWGNPSTKDCIPDALMKEMAKALQPMVKILADVKCLPSFAERGVV